MPPHAAGFEPYVDFDAMTPEMATAVRNSLVEYKAAMEGLIASPEAAPELAARLLAASERASQIVREITQKLHVTPVIVHVAGERREEANPDDAEEQATVQRCARCGSILHMWSERMGIIDPETGPRRLEEDEIPWWHPGARVAKPGVGGLTGIYEIRPPDRPLSEHEHTCADLSSLEDRR